MKQHTLQQSFSVEGKGLHTGMHIHARFVPAEENTGIRFVRTDLAGHPEIPALADYVNATERGTVVGDQGQVVSTIEHAMASLFAHGIDNCRIEVDAPEMPILDGSAAPFVAAIRQAGTQVQDADQQPLILTETLKFEGSHGSRIEIQPCGHLEIQCEVDFQSEVLPPQTATLTKLQNFDRDIADARTFVFVREVAMLLQHNLIKGGDLDNAIVIYDQKLDTDQFVALSRLIGLSEIPENKLGYLNKRPLKADNEPACHKLLDIVGDFCLIGRPLQARILAYKPGHSLNTSVARALRSQYCK